jgi:hypothetical protein
MERLSKVRNAFKMLVGNISRNLGLHRLTSFYTGLYKNVLSHVRVLLWEFVALTGNTLYPQRLALTSPTSGGRSVGIVRVRTKATEFS